MWVAVVTLRMRLKAGWRVGNPDDMLVSVCWIRRSGRGVVVEVWWSRECGGGQYL